MAVCSDRRLESRIVSQNRRMLRNDRQEQIYKILLSRSAMRFRCTAGQLRSAAKAIAMKISQVERRAVVA